jgi:UrcA family protein
MDMNSTSPIRVRTAASIALRAALAVAATALLTVGPAYAECEKEKQAQLLQAKVRYSDLDLTSQDGAATLYRRIVNAARRVCPDAGARDPDLARRIRECREQAVDRAVGAVGSPRLAAIHSGGYPAS